jgi:glutamate-1-semialdehyde aminotransferase
MNSNAPLRQYSASDERQLRAASADLLALGAHHRALQRPLFHGEEDVYPSFVERAEGCRFVDADGREFIDWVSGAGCALLGYAHPAVQAAIVSQVSAGPRLSLQTRVEVQLARELVELIPCAEMAAFAKSGSDCLTAAVRAARAHTGRMTVLYQAYHGWHDWFAARILNRPGLPHESSKHLRHFPYNDLAALEELLATTEGGVAAVVLEPMNFEPPHAGYLAGVRELCTKHGALLVFDELWTWYRLARGGAQEAYGVLPDFACYGKALGNGMPLSAIVGPRRYMRLLPSVMLGMTHREESLSLAAGLAVLSVVRSEPVVEHVQSIGRRLRSALDEQIARHGLVCSIDGMDARLAVHFADQGGLRREHLLALLLRECAARGVLTSGLIGPNYAHDEAALTRSIQVFDEAFAVVAAAVRGNGAAAPSASSVARPLAHVEGHVDHFAPDGAGALAVSGWMLVDSTAAERIEFALPDGTLVAAEATPRPDVVNALHLAPSAASCGFAVRLPEAGALRDGAWELELRVRAAGEVVLRCPLMLRPGWQRAVLTGPAWLGIGVGN